MFGPGQLGAPAGAILGTISEQPVRRHRFQGYTHHDELRAVSSALLGTVDIVADAADLAADFRALTSAAMGKVVGDVALRLWTPQAAGIRLVKQVSPTVEDLTARRAGSGPQRGDYPLGAWGAETRKYHVRIEVQPKPAGVEMLAARAGVVDADADDVLGQGLITAPRRSGRGWPRGRPATSRWRSSDSAGRSRWPRSPATTTPRGCWNAWWTCSTRRPARSGCATGWTRSTR